VRDPDAIAEAVFPELEALESLRQQLKSENRRWGGRIAIVVGVMLALGALVGLADRRVFYAAVAIGVIAGIVIYVAKIASPVSAFKKRFKREAVGSIVRAMEPGMGFNPEDGIPQSVFTRSRLFGTAPDRYRVEDRLSGKIGETSVEISQVHAEERRRRRNSKGHTQTYYVTIFKGIFMVADFHKNFSCTTRVLPDKAEKLFGGLGKMLQGFRPFNNEHLIYLEDPEFEKEFVVYGTDQIESRYILSTSMLRRILDLKQDWKTEVRLSFLDNSVYLAIATPRDLFEPNLKRSAVSREQIRRIVRELALCFDLVDDLNLNTRIWSKA